VFLVWRDRKSSALESCTFWGPVVCPQGKDDASARDSVCRLFSEKTKGQFAPAIMTYDNEQDAEVVARKSPAKQKIEESRLAMRKKLVQGNGVTLLSIRQYITYVAPVRFVPAQQLNDAFGADKGEVEWISAQDLCQSHIHKQHEVALLAGAVSASFAHVIALSSLYLHYPCFQSLPSTRPCPTTW